MGYCIDPLNARTAPVIESRSHCASGIRSELARNARRSPTESPRVLIGWLRLSAFQGCVCQLPTELSLSSHSPVTAAANARSPRGDSADVIQSVSVEILPCRQRIVSRQIGEPRRSSLVDVGMILLPPRCRMEEDEIDRVAHVVRHQNHAHRKRRGRKRRGARGRARCTSAQA